MHSDDPLVRLVAEAVGEALDRRHRAMLIEAAVLAVVISLAVSLPLTLLQNAATARASRADSAYNCRLLTTIADVDGAFVSTDAHLRQQQALNQRQIARLRPGALKRLFTDPETTRLAAGSQRLDASTTRYWTTTLIPELRALTRANCRGQ